MRILIASPDRSLQGLAEELSEAGYRIDLAVQSAEGWRAPPGPKPSLAIIDIQLGEEAARSLMSSLREGEGHCGTVLAVEFVTPETLGATLRW
ncbi:MAG: hypothetical protein ACO3JL_20610, partial [Myxococcota bacterium]